jgi:large subunit ribosomal protein L22
MIAKAHCRFIRISAKKARRLIPILKGKNVETALDLLTQIHVGAKPYFLKLVRSALSNAKVKGVQPEQLYISRIIINEGPTWKRFRANAFGRATEIRKRTSHISVELDLKAKI